MTIIDDFIGSVVGGTMTVVAKVVGGAARLFGDGPAKRSPADHVDDVLFGPGGAKDSPPPPPPSAGPGSSGAPESAGGLDDGAGRAGRNYGNNVNDSSLTDEKLSELLKQIFANNQNARDRVTAILADVQDKTRQIGPELGDPASLVSYHKYLDQKFGEIQKLLSDSQVDATTQSAVMDALGREYQANSPKKDGAGSPAGDASRADGGGGDGGGGDGGGGGSSDGGADDDSGGGSSGPADAAGGGDPLMDPMGGLGPMGGVGPMGGMDPLASMMGPAMAGLNSLPGGLGGLGGLGGGGASPLDGLGPALSSLGPAMAAAKDSFGDSKPDYDKSARDVTDGHEPGKDRTGKSDTPTTGGDDATPSGGPKDSAAPGVEQAAALGPQPAGSAPGAAAPAGAPGSAPGDPRTSVKMPDGTPVTAPSADRAAAMRSVIGGSSVTAGYEGQSVHLPPPGTPVLTPVSRNELQPGDYGQFSTKPPIMYMGNDKIWMDGQLQPIGALQPSSDFLGWSAPPTGGGQQQPNGALALPATPPPAGTV